MRILHLFDLCGVAPTYCKQLEQLGHKSLVLTNFDSLNLKSLYPNFFRFKKENDKMLLLRTIYYLFSFRPQIIHVHVNNQFLKPLKWLQRIFRFSLVYQAHGSELRNKKNSIIKADLNLCTTKDIQRPGFIVLQNPVDRTIFYPGIQKKNTALFIPKYPIDQTETAVNFSSLFGFKLTILEKKMNQKSFAQYLRSFEYFFDMKGLYPMQSKTALEALTSKVKVIDEQGIKHFPNSYNPIKSSKQLEQLYTKLVNKK